MKSAFLVSKGLLCLYEKQNNTGFLVDMEFLFSCSTRHLTRSLRSLVSYRVKHSKRNSISTRAHELFSMYQKSHLAANDHVFTSNCSIGLIFSTCWVHFKCYCSKPLLPATTKYNLNRWNDARDKCQYRYKWGRFGPSYLLNKHSDLSF